MEGQLAQRGSTDFARMGQHATEIESARSGPRNHIPVDGGCNVAERGGLAWLPLVETIVEQVENLHCPSLEEVARLGTCHLAETLRRHPTSSFPRKREPRLFVALGS